MLYRLRKFRDRLRLSWLVFTGHDSLIVTRDKETQKITYYYYPSGDQVFYELADELEHHGMEWYRQWIKNNSIDK